MLWEALASERLFATSDAAAILARLGGGVPLAAIPEKASWAKSLAEIAAKALAFSPDNRWTTAATMAAEIRKAAGLRLAPATTAAAFAKAALGESTKARRGRLELRPATAVAPSPRDPSSGERPHWRATARSNPGGRRWADDDSSSAPVPVAAATATAPALAPAPALTPAPAPAPTPAPTPTPALELEPDTEPHAAPLSLIPDPPDSRPAPAPPPLPARALPAAVVPGLGAPQPPDRASEAHVGESVDVPLSILPPPSDPFEVSPTSIEPPRPVAVNDPITRRRRTVILGGVGALGFVIFALAGVRAACLRPPAATSGHAAVRAADEATLPSGANAKALPVAAASTGPLAGASARGAAPTPPLAPAAPAPTSRQSRVPSPATVAPARPASIVAPPRKTSASPSRPKSRPGAG